MSTTKTTRNAFPRYLTNGRTEVTPVIACINVKGGSGKTTLSLNLAGTAAGDGASVCLLDADNQKTATDNINAAKQAHGPEQSHLAKITPISMDMGHRGMLKSEELLARKEMLSLIQKSIQDYDMVFVDAAGKIDLSTKLLLQFATVILIPVRFGPYDLQGITKFLPRIADREKRNDFFTAAYVPNAIKSGAGLATDFVPNLRESEAITGAGPLDILPQLADRVDHAKAAIASLTTLEYDPSSKASKEFVTLYNAVIDLTNRLMGEAQGIRIENRS